MPTLMDQADGFDWLEQIVYKIITKHGVKPTEVEECFCEEKYKIRRAENDTYQLFSRAENGRYLFVVFAWKKKLIRVITARDMDDRERNYYRRK
ncbi:MAG: BrnT family toxin [Chloroflexota bacterium]|nr:BrnT family toxin [Chloroflexota bacterium]